MLYTFTRIAVGIGLVVLTTSCGSKRADQNNSPGTSSPEYHDLYRRHNELATSYLELSEKLRKVTDGSYQVELAAKAGTSRAR